MNNPKNLNISTSIEEPLTFWESLRYSLFADPFSNLPSFFLMGVGFFGIVTLISSFFVDFLNSPFLIVAILSSFFAMWHIRMLGSLKEQIEHLTEENNKLTEENRKFSINNKNFEGKIDQFSKENDILSGNMFEMEQSIEVLKINNDRLHFELEALQTLRGNLQTYADEAQMDFSQLLGEVNQSFQRLEIITMENERALLQRIAQDLEFLDHQPGMQRDEYNRFVERIPTHLQDAFIKVGNTSFDQMAGEDEEIDYQEIRALVHSVINDKDKVNS